MLIKNLEKQKITPFEIDGEVWEAEKNLEISILKISFGHLALVYLIDTWSLNPFVIGWIKYLVQTLGVASQM